jgi:DNA modification methylase
MTITLLTGDARDVLPTLASNSVHCVVTSPPYAVFREVRRVLRDDAPLSGPVH